MSNFEGLDKDWIPAFAGMTINGHGGLFMKPSTLNLEILRNEHYQSFMKEMQKWL